MLSQNKENLKKIKMASKKCDEVVDFQMAKRAKRAHMLACGEKYRETIKS